jgi:hypothetical protein
MLHEIQVRTNKSLVFPLLPFRVLWILLRLPLVIMIRCESRVEPGHYSYFQTPYCNWLNTVPSVTTAIALATMSAIVGVIPLLLDSFGFNATRSRTSSAVRVAL